MNVETGTEAAQFPEKEYINGIFVAVPKEKLRLTPAEGRIVIITMVTSSHTHLSSSQSTERIRETDSEGSPTVSNTITMVTNPA